LRNVLEEFKAGRLTKDNLPAFITAKEYED